MINPYFKSTDHTFTLLQGDCFELLPQFDFKFDMIFADPPYFLSNDGISVQNGKVVSVNKGDWDKGGTPEYINDFNRKWLTLCREKLKENGSIWISGTYHNIFSVANIPPRNRLLCSHASYWHPLKRMRGFWIRLQVHPQRVSQQIS